MLLFTAHSVKVPHQKPAQQRGIHDASTPEEASLWPLIRSTDNAILGAARGPPGCEGGNLSAGELDSSALTRSRLGGGGRQG